MSRASIMLVAATAVLAGGCGEAAFSAHARDNDPGDLARALQATSAGEARAAQATAYLVTADKKLVAFDLGAGKIAWETSADVRSRIVVGRGTIAHKEGERDVVTRDAATGNVRATYTMPIGELFVGAALDCCGDGNTLLVVTQLGDGKGVVSAADARTGKLRWRHPAPDSLGAPALRGDLVALPFAHQDVVLLDAKSGRELARVRASDEEVSFVRALPEGIFYGDSHGVYRLDDKSAGGSRARSSYASARLGSEQVRTAYNWDAYQPQQADYSAFDRNRILWRGVAAPSASGFRDDLAVVHSYRYFFAFDAAKGKLRWAWAHPRTDVVGSEDAGSAILFASSDGDLGALDPRTGAARTIAKTSLRVSGATFDADGLDVAGAQPPSAAEIAATLEQIIWDHDARFSAVKLFATAALGDVPGLPATLALLKIVRAPAKATAPGAPPPAARKKAGDLIVARKDREAVPAMLEALAEHYDFLEDKAPLGVDVLARALAALDVREAAPLLAAHLVDHETPQSALRDIATALAQLGGKEAEHALGELLLEYRSDPLFMSDPQPLTIAGEALLKMGPDARKVATYAAEDHRTMAPVARALRAIVASEPDKSDKKDPQEKPENQ
jgi:outer membrane protein assembly factor BamB